MISVLIATYNRAGSLALTLESLVCQDNAGEYEIVVVDNNSTDCTEAVCGIFASEHPEVRFTYSHQPRQGLSYARNSGIERSNGEVMVCIDDDEKAGRGFVAGYRDFFEAYPHVSVAGGRIVPDYEVTPPSWYSPFLERPLGGKVDHGPAVKPFPGKSYPGGGNIGFRREAIERVGMFDPNLGRTGTSVMGGEEKDLIQRLRAAGEEIYYLPDAVIYHDTPASRLTREYLFRLAPMIGCSERVRTLNISRVAWLKRLATEAFKWGGTLAILTFYTLTLRPGKGWVLVVFRWGISRGLLGLVP